MHMADALVAPAVAATMYVCSGGVAGFSVKKVRLESDPKKIPVMGVMGAFVFAAQMINFTIPGTGSSGHLCGVCRVFNNDRCAADPVSAVCGRRSSGARVQHLEYGVLWVLSRLFPVLASDDEKGNVARKDCRCFHPWVRGDAAAWRF